MTLPSAMAPKAAPGPSEHFPWHEFACQDRLRTPYPLDWRQDRAVILAGELERIRARIGPFRPMSVYRTWDHHVDIYRSLRPPQEPPRHSQHLAGRAADVPAPPDMRWAEFRAAIVAAAEEPGSQIRYLKFYRRQRFAHVDVRPTTTLKIEGDA